MSNYCNELHQLFLSLPHHTYEFNPAEIPLNGIYILFEEGEKAHNGARIVRVGTHIGQNRLRARLKQHFIREKKDHSIFRKNIGLALLNRDHDPFLIHWNIDLISRDARARYAGQIDLEKIKEVEKRVSEVIHTHFWFVAFSIPDVEDRKKFESRIISTVARCPDCGPSPDWLGHFSPKKEIRESGLWLTRELNKQPIDDQEMENLRRIILTK